jgi:hypothetical protein
MSMKRFTVDLSDEMYQRLRMEAAQSMLSMKEVVEAALKEHLGTAHEPIVDTTVFKDAKKAYEMTDAMATKTVKSSGAKRPLPDASGLMFPKSAQAKGRMGR